MNLRHAAALALVGWYLMAPPLSKDGDRVNENAPLSTWIITQSFDSARECERFWVFMDSKVDANVNLSPVVKQGHHLSVCVASDDPRLAK